MKDLHVHAQQIAVEDKSKPNPNWRTPEVGEYLGFRTYLKDGQTVTEVCHQGKDGPVWAEKSRKGVLARRKNRDMAKVQAGVKVA